MRDYRAWHKEYDDPSSALSQRLAVVRQRLSERLSAAPAGPLCVISMCAGQGRDVIPVVASHGRRADVRAVLLELDAENVHYARESAARAGLSNVDVVQTDASISDAYRPYLPGNVVLACGIFGNISEPDIERTVGHLSMLCAPGASVIWTRHWQDPALNARIRQWFTESGFTNASFDALQNESKSGIGVAQLVAPPGPFEPGYRFFTFLR